MPNQQIISLRDIDQLATEKVNGISGYLIQEYIEAADEIKDFISSAPHSIRVFTLRNRKNLPPVNCVVQYGYMRLGRVGLSSDHGSLGSLYCRIDIEHGTLSQGIIKNDTTKQFFFSNVSPDTSINIVGRKLPYWDELKALVIRAANQLPEINFVGWDIVLSDTGPHILEGNVGTDMLFHQLLLGGHRENGIVDEWQNRLGFTPPDGTFLWALRHFCRGRRLKWWETVVCKLLSLFQLN